MKSKLTLYRICWGITMAVSAAVYLFLLPKLRPFSFLVWNWPMLAALLLAEFEIFEGIDYFLSDRVFKKPKLCKRLNIVSGSIILLGLVLMFLNAIYHFIKPDLFGLYFLMFFALCLILFGHGLNCFFDSLNYFLHEAHKKWYKTAWNVTKMGAVVLIVLLVTGRVIWALLP